MNRPSVSVIIPAYNCARHVAEAVDSALAQPETWDIILIEDGSIDDTLAVCQRLRAEHPRHIRLLRHAEGGNHGAGASRNLGIRAARGRYIAFLDADDWYLPGRFRCSARILDERPNVDAVYEHTELYFTDDEQRRQWEAMGSPPLRALEAGDDLLRRLVGGAHGTIHTNGILIRKSAFEHTGLFDEQLRLSQDAAMWWKLAASCHLVPGQTKRPVARYRRYEGNRYRLDNPERVRAPLAVALTVYRWALRKRLPAHRRRVLRHRLIHIALTPPTGNFHGARFRLWQLYGLQRCALEAPSALLDPLLLRKVLSCSPFLLPFRRQ